MALSGSAVCFVRRRLLKTLQFCLLIGILLLPVSAPPAPLAIAPPAQAALNWSSDPGESVPPLAQPASAPPAPLSLSRSSDPGGSVPHSAPSASTHLAPPGADDSVASAAVLGYGDTVGGNIVAPGDVVTYTFSAEAGDVILARAASEFLFPQLWIYDAGGALLNSAWALRHVELTQTLTQTGVYSLAVSALDSGPNTGAFGLYLQRLNGPSNAVALGFGDTVASSIAVTAEMDAYTFSAVAGDVVLVRMMDVAGGIAPEARVYDPDGELLSSGVGGSAGVTVALPSTGSYAVLAGSFSGAGVGDYGLHLQRVNAPGGALAFPYGHTMTNTIELPAEMNAYTFSGDAGDLILLRSDWVSGGPFATAPQVDLYGPGGDLLATMPSQARNEISHTLPTTGTYALISSYANSSFVATYALHLQRANRPGNARVLSYGSTVTGVITLPAQMDAYTFTATGGDTILATMGQVSGGILPRLRLYRSDGLLLSWAIGATEAAITRTLVADGEYILLAEDLYGGVGTYQLSLQRLGNVGPTLAAVVTGPRNVSPGQTVDFTIEWGNLFTTTLRDAVIVAQLPWEGDPVGSTAGGLYWWGRHQMVWKLGDLDPGQSGLLSVRVRFYWGLPQGQTEVIVVLTAGQGLPNAVIDLAEYLAFVPVTVTDEREMSTGEVDALLASDPVLDDLFSYAQELGFHYNEVAFEETLSDGSQMVQLWLFNLLVGEALAVVREDDTRLIHHYSPTEIAVYDRGGGLSWNVETGATETWGTWGTSSVSSAQVRARGKVPMGQCMENCINEKLAEMALDKIVAPVGWARLAQKCFECIDSPMPSNCRDCTLGFAELTPADVLFVLTDCKSDCDDCQSCADAACEAAKCHGCTGPRTWCEQVLLGSVCYEWTEQCDTETGLYYGRTATTSLCAYCVNGKCTGRSASSGASLASFTQGGVCAAGDDQCDDVDDTWESEISLAMDPNEKSGPPVVLPGETITYVIDYENEGQGIAFGVWVQDRLPLGLDETTLVIEQGGQFITSTRTIAWTIGELQPGEHGQVRFRVQVGAGVPGGTTVINQATVFFPSVPEETPTNPLVTLVDTVVAYPQTVETIEGIAVPITLTAASVSTGSLSYTIVRRPLYGTLSGNAPVLSYAPGPNFEGLDRFSFVASDGLSESLPAEVTILVHTGAEAIPPKVLSTAPKDQEQDVPAQNTLMPGNTFKPTIWVGFSEPISAATVTTATFYVRDDLGQLLPGRVTYDGTSTAARFLPLAPLQHQMAYTVTLTTAIEDTSGNALSAPYKWSFKTAKGSFTVHFPVVLRRYP